jgi:hypothetical protein
MGQEPPTALQLSAAARDIIGRAQDDGVAIDDGNVVDLLVDNLDLSPDEARAVIAADYKLAAAFARAARR